MDRLKEQGLLSLWARPPVAPVGSRAAQMSSTFTPFLAGASDYMWLVMASPQRPFLCPVTVATFVGDKIILLLVYVKKSNLIKIK